MGFAEPARSAAWLLASTLLPRRTAMLLFIPRSLCALKRVAAKAEHHRFGATQGIRIALRSGLYRAEATDGRRAIEGRFPNISQVIPKKRLLRAPPSLPPRTPRASPLAEARRLCRGWMAAGSASYVTVDKFVAMFVKVLLALVPITVIAVMHTTMISANMTAYSTAVGPSSRFRKVVAADAKWVTMIVLRKKMCISHQNAATVDKVNNRSRLGHVFARHKLQTRNLSDLTVVNEMTSSS
jgi:hypothetical protein